MGIMDAMAAAGGQMGGRMGQKPAVSGRARDPRWGARKRQLQQGLGPSMGRLGGMMQGQLGGRQKIDQQRLRERLMGGGRMVEPPDKRIGDPILISYLDQMRQSGKMPMPPGVPRGIPGGEMDPRMMARNRMQDMMQQRGPRPMMNQNPQQMLMQERARQGRMY